MPHYRQLQSREYLGFWDFDEGEEKTVTIKDVVREEVLDPKSNTRKAKVVVYFKDCKKAIFNTTNCEMTSQVLGSPRTEDWIGKQVILHTEKIRAFGKLQDAIRVMEKKPTRSQTKAKPVTEVETDENGRELYCERCKKPIHGAGQITDGKAMADYTFNHCGEELCADCYKAEMENK